MALVNERKISQDDVIATDLQSEPHYEGDKDSSPDRGKIIGYSVTRPFNVKVRDLTVFAKLVDELLAIGGVEFSGIDSGLTTEKELQGDVWQRALTNARETAERTLSATGTRVDSIFAVSPVTFPDIRQRIFGSNEALAAQTERVITADPSQYRLGRITISQSVHVLYLISPVNKLVDMSQPERRQEPRDFIGPQFSANGANAPLRYFPG